MKYILALDQGTTSSRAILFDESLSPVASRAIEFRQIYPEPGWVEHDPEDILNSITGSMRAVVGDSGVDVSDILAIGITNQRETTLVWDKRTGAPICNAIVWQCRRTAPIVERLVADGLAPQISEKCGLIPDAYFSGTKLNWILANVPGARERAERGEVAFGTVDSFLAFRLTNERPHVTDATNASRTMLFNISSGSWDGELLRALDIPLEILPRVIDSSEFVGTLRREILGREIPVCALIGDQQSSLFAQGCTRPGMVKNTYGTGCFVLMSTGSERVYSKNGLVTTVAAKLGGKITYALEGSVFVAGAAVQWLRDEMGLIANSAESSEIAMSIPDNGGVYFVPAFTGLGAPYWDMYARGTIVGLTRGAGRRHIVRAALESVAYQSFDVLDAMAREAGREITALRVDGGASRNDFLMRFQADILGAEVVRPRVTETTAMGAAMLAGRAAGLWRDSDFERLAAPETRFAPQMSNERRSEYLRRWARAVERARDWAE